MFYCPEVHELPQEIISNSLPEYIEAIPSLSAYYSQPWRQLIRPVV
jgi:hypothetical protein